MQAYFIVGFGGFVGASLRFLISGFFPEKNSTFPYGTMLVNLAGCLLIGIVYGFISKGQFAEGWRFFIVAGLLGGFTTFSAFSIETLQMLRAGQTSSAVLYVLTSVLIGLGLTWLGLMLAK